eukprot:gb/GFBE01057608.1/.p1 GENE.gb/GFBE01057608.1/~~gb/GFBE01057608.1/.p1  ORF type:complete len:314 (+),score=73.75 gb/GFBE01057608.1/:1-942(+)
MQPGKLSIPQIPLANIPRIPQAGEGRFCFCPSPRKVITRPAEPAPAPTPVEEAAPECEAEEPAAKPKSTVQVLKELVEPGYEPSDEEVEGYAEWMGMDVQSERHLLWLARAALKEPCPAPWKPCRTDTDGIFYFNFKTGESMWDHPSDVHYKQLYEQEKAKSKTGAGLVPPLCLVPKMRNPEDDCRPRSPRKLTARAKQEATIAMSAASANQETMTKYGKVKVLEEELEADYEPSQEELEEYAAWLGMDLQTDQELFWIARAGLKETCPEPWKPCQTETGDIFYFNFSTGESIWDHPCDEHYKELYRKHKCSQ